MRPVWEEEWGSDCGFIFEPSDPQVEIAVFAEDHPDDDTGHARARLASFAPAMARLLLRIEAKNQDAFGGCNAGCTDDNCFAHSARTILRAAGVVE